MTLSTDRPELKYVPLGLVDDPRCPSRSTMDETALEELAENIRAIGLQQPIVLARVGERFEVSAGHRRRIACERAGLVEVPALIYPTHDAAMYGIQYAENRFREELSAHDEAILFIELLEGVCLGDVDKLCGVVHEKRAYVEGRLELALGDPDVLAAMKPGGITIGVARELNKITDELSRRYYLRHAIHDGATIATVTGWVQQWRSTIGPVGGDQAPSPAPVTSAPATQYDPHRCYVCGRSDPRHLPEMVAIHSHCVLAVLDPMLEELHARRSS